MKLNVSSVQKTDKIKMFDIKSMEKKLKSESKYITDLWKILPFSGSLQNDAESAEEEDKNPAGNNRKKKKLMTFQIGGKQLDRAKSLEELHNRLQDMKGKKLMYKDKLLKKGIKNRLTKKKRKEDRKLKKTLLKVKSNPDFEEKAKPTVKPVKPVYNSEGKIVFSKFDFTESGNPTESVSKKNKDTKDPRKRLLELEKQNEKLKKLETEGKVQKANELKEKFAWKTALQKAEGIKVKDDPELLKKSLKKHKERKEQSKKKWAAREEKLEHQQEERQTKRTANITKAKKEKKVKKMKKAAKRGRVIPGF